MQYKFNSNTDQVSHLIIFLNQVYIPMPIRFGWNTDLGDSEIFLILHCKIWQQILDIKNSPRLLRFNLQIVPISFTACLIVACWSIQRGIFPLKPVADIILVWIFFGFSLSSSKMTTGVLSALSTAEKWGQVSQLSWLNHEYPALIWASWKAILSSSSAYKSLFR